MYGTVRELTHTIHDLKNWLAICSKEAVDTVKLLQVTVIMFSKLLLLIGLCVFVQSKLQETFYLLVGLTVASSWELGIVLS